MKKLIKHFSCFSVLCTLIATMFIPNAFALQKEDNTESEVISIEEYEATLKAEGEKYGIDCEILSYDPSIKLTSEMLQNDLDSLRYSAENFKTIPLDSSRVIPTNGTFYGEFLAVVPPYGQATIVVEIDATVDAQNSAVIEVTGARAYQSGAFLNFVSWETTNITTKKNNPELGVVTVVVSGRATFSYADPFTGITTGRTKSITEQIEIECW